MTTGTGRLRPRADHRTPHKTALWPWTVVRTPRKTVLRPLTVHTPPPVAVVSAACVAAAVAAAAAAKGGPRNATPVYSTKSTTFYYYDKIEKERETANKKYIELFKHQTTLSSVVSIVQNFLKTKKWVRKKIIGIAFVLFG